MSEDAAALLSQGAPKAFTIVRHLSELDPITSKAKPSFFFMQEKRDLDRNALAEQIAVAKAALSEWSAQAKSAAAEALNAANGKLAEAEARLVEAEKATVLADEKLREAAPKSEALLRDANTTAVNIIDEAKMQAQQLIEDAEAAKATAAKTLAETLAGTARFEAAVRRLQSAI